MLSLEKGNRLLFKKKVAFLGKDIEATNAICGERWDREYNMI